MASELTLDAINALLSQSRTRGDYEVELRDFINSDHVGIEVDLSSGPLAGKDAKNVATGFNNARKKMNADTGQPAVVGGNAVKVILKMVATGQKDTEGNDIKEGHVFLINTAKLGTEEAAAVQAQPDEQQ